MAATLPSNPSGITITNIQSWALADSAMSVAASGTGTISQTNLDYLTEKSILAINSCLGTSYFISGNYLSPTPDYDIFYLFALQLECKLAGYNINASKSNPDVKSIRVDDIAIEFGDVSEFKLKSAESKIGPCSEFDELADRYLAEETLGNAAIIWAGTTRLWENVDNDGQSAQTLYNPQGLNSAYPPDGMGGPNYSDGIRVI